MTVSRKSGYVRKTTRLRPPSDELRRVVRILEHLCKHATPDPADPSGPAITRFPEVKQFSADDDPLASHIDNLKKILKGDDAAVVLGQRPGGGRRATPTEERWLVANLYFSVRGKEKPYRCTHHEACEKIWNERPDWKKKYGGEAIRKLIREQRRRPVVFSEDFATK